MSTQTEQRLTEQEYLTRERVAETKSEYLGGRMYGLAGASARHNLIAGNVFASLHAQLRGGPCRAFTSDMRVKAGRAGLYTYPDVSVVCGEPRFEDAALDTLLNPVLLVEVLSGSTEGYDRGKKFEMYRGIESFKEYLPISQDRVYVELHRRQPDGRWLMSETTDAGDVVALEAVGCRLSLRDVYERVELTARS